MLSFSSFNSLLTQTLQNSLLPETRSPEKGCPNVHGTFQAALARIKYKQDWKGYKTLASAFSLSSGAKKSASGSAHFIIASLRGLNHHLWDAFGVCQCQRGQCLLRASIPLKQPSCTYISHKPHTHCFSVQLCSGQSGSKFLPICSPLLQRFLPVWTHLIKPNSLGHGSWSGAVEAEFASWENSWGCVS